jgi:hypothetical protein
MEEPNFDSEDLNELCKKNHLNGINTEKLNLSYHI